MNNDKGILSFFFGKRKRVRNMKREPFTFAQQKDGTPIAFVKQCDVDYIFDSDSWTCVKRTTQKGRDIAIKRIEKYQNTLINPSSIAGLWQFKDNCWFNSLLMCLFFSERTRVIFNELRKNWVKNVTTKSEKKHILNIFTFMMEIPHYHQTVLNTLDSNLILDLLHKYDKSLFTHPGYKGGSGILYCKKLLTFLGLDDYIEIRIMSLKNSKNIYVEMNEGDFIQILENPSRNAVLDTISEMLFGKNISLCAIYVNIEHEFILPSRLNHLELDCMYLSNYKSPSNFTHAVAGITCQGGTYLYDGERAFLKNNLKEFPWKSDNPKSFAMSYDKTQSVRYDFSKGHRIGFYVPQHKISTNNK